MSSMRTHGSPTRAESRASQDQVGAEHPALAHLCAHFEEAALTIPPGLAQDEGGGGIGDPAVQPELLSVSLGGLADVLEPAGDEQSSTERPEPTLPPKLPEVGRHHAGRREPSERRSPVLGRAEIHPPVAEHVEGEATTRPEPKGSHAACRTLVEDERFDAGHLSQPPYALVQLPGSQGLAKKIHITHLPTSNDAPGVEYPHRGREVNRERAIPGDETEARCRPTP